MQHASQEKNRDWAKGLYLLAEMADGAFRDVPDVDTYNAAVVACEKAAQWEEAVRLLADMHTARVEPNAMSYTFAISACERSLQWQQAMDLFEEMKIKRIQ